jgi:hypothetical protein
MFTRRSTVEVWTTCENVMRMGSGPVPPVPKPEFASGLETVPWFWMGATETTSGGTGFGDVVALVAKTNGTGGSS